MQRLLPFLLAVLIAGTARAREPEKNLLGIRVGLESAYVRAQGERVHGTTHPRLGFRLGVSDQVLLWRAFPLYLETGIHFSSRGGRYGGISFRPMYLQVPLLATWRFGLGSRMSIRPYAGICYGVGIGGMARSDESWTELFGHRGLLRRSDLNLRAGLELSVRRICIGVGFDGSCLNILRPGYDDPDTGSQLLPGGISRLNGRSLSISIGYDF